MQRYQVTKIGGWSPVLLVCLVASGFVLSTSMGIRQSLGLFLGPIVSGTGLSVATFGLAMAVQNLVWGIGQPIMGAFADRFGGQRIVCVGAVLFALGLSVMSLGSALGLFVGGGIFIGLAVAATSHGVLVGILSRVAGPDVRALAVSILAAVGSLGTFVIAPGTQWALDALSWEIGVFVLAAVAATMALFSFGLRANARPEVASSRETPNALVAFKDAMSHRGFIAMTIAFFACGFQLIFVATHLPNFIALCGLPATLGAQAIALIGLCNAIGTLAAGRLGEIFGHRPVLAVIYALRTLAIACYAVLPVSVESTLLFGAAMGLLWLSVVPPVSALIHAMFGSANFGLLFGIMFFSHQIGAFLGAYIGGLTFGMTGSYDMAWIAMVVVGVLAAIIQFSMNDRPRHGTQVTA